MQLTKAFTNYVRDPNPDPQSGPGYGFFAVGTMGYLYFPIQDHDQSVLVDYTWVHRVNGQDRPVGPTGTENVDLLVVDLETGLTLDSRTLQSPNEDQPIQGTSNANGEINYLNGAIRFPDTVSW